VSDDRGARIDPALCALVRGVLGPVFRFVFRIRTFGAENIPPHGPTLFVANHISMWDPPMIGHALVSRRRIYFMAKSELFEIPVLGWAIRRLGAFPVERGNADRTAIRIAREVLARGDALLMFPEGTRQADGDLGQAWPGAGALALADGVVVVPVVIEGSNRRIGPVRVTIGKPLDLSDLPEVSRGERSQVAADRMMAAIGDLRASNPGGRE
jgi:1-acyl-sn-glycerol-3-phosphate acyltransferase